MNCFSAGSSEMFFNCKDQSLSQRREDRLL